MIYWGPGVHRALVHDLDVHATVAHADAFHAFAGEAAEAVGEGQEPVAVEYAVRHVVDVVLAGVAGEACVLAEDVEHL